MAFQALNNGSEYWTYTNQTAQVVKYHAVNRPACEQEINSADTACLGDGTWLSRSQVGQIIGTMIATDGIAGPQLKAGSPTLHLTFPDDIPDHDPREEEATAEELFANAP
jgi:hypothetical protein